MAQPAWLLLEMPGIDLDGVSHIQHPPSGSVPCLPTMVAKKENWREPEQRGQGRCRYRLLVRFYDKRMMFPWSSCIGQASRSC
jgi:hypothetical protein